MAITAEFRYCCDDSITIDDAGVITSYSIHYTKLYDKLARQRVTFTKGGYQHRNGFEPVNKNMPSNYYQSITIGDSTLLLPWKSVGTTGQDKLFATPVEDPAHTFAFQNGSAVSASAEGTSYGVWVTPPPVITSYSIHYTKLYDPVGSSASRMRGSPTTARAAATLCC